jgi:hypothetical protein
MREFTDYPLRLRRVPEEWSSQTVHLFTAALYSVEFNIYLQNLNNKVAADCQSCFHIQCPALHLNGAGFRLSFMSSVVIRITKQHICSNITLLLIYAARFNLKFRPSSEDITKT